jgi:hypothetical protein
MKKTGYLILLICLLQIACTRNSKTLESAQEPCDSDSIDIYCLVDNYYAPLNSINEFPVKLYGNSHLAHFFCFESYDNPVFSLLRDSFHFSNSDFEFDGLFYDSIGKRFHFRDDTIPFVWAKNRFKNIDFVCRNEIDSFNNAEVTRPYIEAATVFTSLFGKGYVYLSRPLISKNQKMLLIGEEVVNNSDVYQTPVYVFFKYSNRWCVRKFDKSRF